jgi:hypothetical protein
MKFCMIPIVWNLIQWEPKTCTQTKGWIEEVNESCGGETVGGLAKHTKQSNKKIVLRNDSRTRWSFVWYQSFEIWFKKSPKHVHEQRDELKKWMNHVWNHVWEKKLVIGCQAKWAESKLLGGYGGQSEWVAIFSMGPLQK